MKKIKHFVIILINLILLNSCAKDSEDNRDQPCPKNEIVSMKINGEVRQFEVIGRGIDLDNAGSGHTLHLNLFTGVFSPQQNSYAITLKLPYKGIGNNIIKEIGYLRVHNATSIEGDFLQGQLQSEVKVNSNTCFSATFSGSAIINGNEIIISEGIINHIYDDPF